MYRIGEGFDSHRLEAGRNLTIGCVEVPAPFGSVAHSDGDVLAHAIVDAAARLHRGGGHRPALSARATPSGKAPIRKIFLAEAARLLAARGGRIANVDSTVILETPRLAAHVPAMRSALAHALGCHPTVVSVKAKSAEGLGAIGASAAMEARAVVLVWLPDPR